MDPTIHDIRFVEDNWENPTLGAWGLGWEVWLNGMEAVSYTHLLQRMLNAQSFHCAISCLPPLFRVLFRPEWMRARNGQLFRLRSNHLTLLIEQNNFYARGAKRCV